MASWSAQRIEWRQRGGEIGVEMFGDALTRPKDAREWRFCCAFVGELLRDASEGGLRVSRQRIERTGSAAIERAGYREKKPATIAQRANEMLALTRIQRGVMEAFAAVGVDVNRCAAVLAEVMDHPLKVDGAVSAGDKLKAVDLFFRTTVGYAPTKSANLHGTAPVDGFFDAEDYAKTPPMKAVSESIS